MFGTINTTQWLWYYYNWFEDQTEQFERNRDMVEYNSSFVAPEAVSQIRKDREDTIKVSDKEFFSGIEQMFGKPLNLSESARDNSEMKAQAIDVDALGNIIKEHRKEKSKDESIKTNYKHWLNFELGA